jgi:hypothetical protein
MVVVAGQKDSVDPLRQRSSVNLRSEKVEAERHQKSAMRRYWSAQV